LSHGSDSGARRAEYRSQYQRARIESPYVDPRDESVARALDLDQLAAQPLDRRDSVGEVLK
jgi:hypothetical protein